MPSRAFGLSHGVALGPLELRQGGLNALAGIRSFPHNMDKSTIEYMLSGCNTNTGIDLKIHGLILALLRKWGDPELFEAVRRDIMRRRAAWLERYVLLQAKWQRIGRNKRRDMFALRDKYIAPHPQYMDEYRYEQRQNAYNRKRRPDLYLE